MQIFFWNDKKYASAIVLNCQGHLVKYQKILRALGYFWILDFVTPQTALNGGPNASRQIYPNTYGLKVPTLDVRPPFGFPDW